MFVVFFVLVLIVGGIWWGISEFVGWIRNVNDRLNRLEGRARGLFDTILQDRVSANRCDRDLDYRLEQVEHHLGLKKEESPPE